jgi:hypothetical protein
MILVSRESSQIGVDQLLATLVSLRAELRREATMNDHSPFLCSLLVAMVASTSLLNFQFSRSQASSCSCNRFSRDWQLLVRCLSQSTLSN